MKNLLLIPLIVLLSGCGSILADDDSVMDQAGYSTYSGLNQNPDPGTEASSRMVNAAIRR